MRIFYVVNFFTGISENKKGGCMMQPPLGGKIVFKLVQNSNLAPSWSCQRDRSVKTVGVVWLVLLKV